jgi:hypothetical protein
MPLASAERLAYAVVCPKCARATPKMVAWLATFEQLPCATPGCGNVISLQTAENRSVIQMLTDFAGELDEFLAEKR